MNATSARITCFICVGLIASAPLFVVDSPFLGIGISIVCALACLALSEHLFRYLTREQNYRNGKDLS